MARKFSAKRVKLPELAGGFGEWLIAYLANLQLVLLVDPLVAAALIAHLREVAKIFAMERGAAQGNELWRVFDFTRRSALAASPSLASGN